jgi:hypothetical protein
MITFTVHLLIKTNDISTYICVCIFVYLYLYNVFTLCLLCSVQLFRLIHWSYNDPFSLATCYLMRYKICIIFVLNAHWLLFSTITHYNSYNK